MKIKARRYQWALFGLLLTLGGLTIYAQRQIASARSNNPNLSWRASLAAALGSDTKPVNRPNNVATSAPTVDAAASNLIIDPTVVNPTALVPAQAGGNYNIVKSVVAGGGGTSTGGNTKVTGTIGQSAIGTSSGGQFALSGGFAGGGVLCPTIALTPTTLPTGQLSVPYNQALTATGGTGSYGFTICNGALPANLTLSPTGVISGAPIFSGSFNFTICATDVNACAGSRDYTLTIGNCPAITISPTTLPSGTVGLAYPNQTFTAMGGAGSYSFAVSAGTLPGGLTLTGGVLSGTPTTPGTFNFTIRATDTNGCTGEQAYSINISGATGGGLMFYSLAHPIRLLDTRPGAGGCYAPGVPIAGGTSLTQPARGVCDGLTIPTNAAAITGNITTVNSGGGYLTLYPSDAAQPNVANSNYGPNEVINNVFTVGLSAVEGAFNIFALNTTDVVVDVTGYYAPPGTGGLYFHPLPSPVRLLDTRMGASGCFIPGVPLPGGADTTQQATGACSGIPAAARAIVGNATTVGPQSGGYLTLFPADAARPNVASSNYGAGQVVNGPFTVGLSPAGQFKIFTTATTDLVIDVLGYYSTEATDANGAGLLFTPLAHPVRLLDTRTGASGCYATNAPLTGLQVYTQPARGLCDGLTIPASALGVVGNATVVGPVAGGYLTLWPSSASQPSVATSNFTAGQVFNRHFIVGLGAGDGAFKMFSSATTDLVIDLSGYFAP